MKRMYLALLTLLTLLPLVSALEAGEPYIVNTIDKCYHDATVKVTAASIIEGEYNVNGCRMAGRNPDMWSCSCPSNKPLDIVINTKADTVNTYDVTVQYYIGPLQPTAESNYTVYDENLDLQRTEKFNNLQFGPSAAPAPPFEWPALPKIGDVGTNMIVIVIGTVAVGFIILVIYIIKKIFFTDEEAEIALREDKKKFDDEKLMDWVNSLK